jgi:hypothetical protein
MVKSSVCAYLCTPMKEGLSRHLDEASASRLAPSSPLRSRVAVVELSCEDLSDQGEGSGRRPSTQATSPMRVEV